MLRFDDRVALITGAGRGLGRAYALLLAARGAKVVVNDPGVSMQGEGTDAGPAQSVVDEIRAAGGQAIASTDSVATPQGGQAMIDLARDHFGSIDSDWNTRSIRLALKDEAGVTQAGQTLALTDLAA